MARYRKIDIRIWGDAKFLQLDVVGRYLFLNLLSHPHMTPLGVIRTTRLGLYSEHQRLFDKETFDVQFDLLLERNLIKYDHEYAIVILPKFLRYNAPANPNALKSLEKHLSELPECPSVEQLWRDLEPYRERLGVTVRGNGCQQRLGVTVRGNGCEHRSPNQEQEQEQKQEQEQEVDSPPPPPQFKERARASRPIGTDLGDPQPWRQVLATLLNSTPLRAAQIRPTANNGEHLERLLAAGVDATYIIETANLYADAIRDGKDDAKWWGRGMFKADRWEIVERIANEQRIVEQRKIDEKRREREEPNEPVKVMSADEIAEGVKKLQAKLGIVHKDMTDDQLEERRLELKRQIAERAKNVT